MGNAVWLAGGMGYLVYRYILRRLLLMVPVFFAVMFVGGANGASASQRLVDGVPDNPTSLYPIMGNNISSTQVFRQIYNHNRDFDSLAPMPHLSERFQLETGLARLKANPDILVYRWTAANISYIGFNTSKASLDNSLWAVWLD